MEEKNKLYKRHLFLLSETGERIKRDKQMLNFKYQKLINRKKD